VGSSSTLSSYQTDPTEEASATRWTSGGTASSLGLLPSGTLGFSIGAAGLAASQDGSTIVGTNTFSTGRAQGFVWTAAGGMVGIPTALGGTATGVSSNGAVVVGTNENNSGQTEAYRWTAATGPVALGALSTNYVGSSANGVSADGSIVVGNSLSNNESPEAFAWTAGAGMKPLGFLPGIYNTSNATAISANGATVVGSSINASENSEAVRWASGVIAPLGFLSVLPTDNPYSGATGVSGDGSTIVGFSGAGTYGGQNTPSPDSAAAFIWTADHGMQSLQALLWANDALPAGWNLWDATGISPDGRTIVGIGTDPAGKTEAWIAQVPEPSGLALSAVAAAVVVFAVVGRRRDFHVRRALLAVVLCGLCAAQAQAGSYTFSGLGFLGNATASSASGVSADGSAVVGSSGSNAFFWTSGAGMTSIPFLPQGSLGFSDNANGTAISPDGATVVGTNQYSSGPTEAFGWRAFGGTLGIGYLPTASYSTAAAVTGSGSTMVVAGASTPQALNSPEAYSWSPVGGFVPLGFLSNTYQQSSAAGLSANGSMIVGNSLSNRERSEAFLWTAGGGMVGLGFLSNNYQFSAASAISADGSTVVGQSTNAFDTYQAFRSTTGGSMVPLSFLSSATDASNATAASSDGSVIVGWSSTSSSQTPSAGASKAVLWTSSGVQSVQSILQSQGALPAGWTLWEATGISANGQIIVGVGTDPAGHTEAWIAQLPPTAVAIPEPSSIALAALGLIGLAAWGWRRKRSRTAALVLLAVLVTFAGDAQAVTMSWSPVGNPNNPPDPLTSLGAVSYSYDIGTYDVTNSQYVAFLNSNDPTGANALHLYNALMSNATFGGINYSSSALNGSKYSVISGAGNHPVNEVTFYSTLRFANWLNNDQVAGSTETGAYTLLGDTPTPSNGTSVMRSAGAMIVLPSLSEWYKAAYYNSATGSYFQYPNSTNAAPIASLPTGAINSGNFGSVVGKPTDVGAYTGTTSPYGVYDMGDNVYQWIEANIGPGISRGFAGAPYSAGSDNSLSQYLINGGFGRQPDVGYNDLGFRVAMLIPVPEPSSVVLAALGLIGLAAWGWRRKRS
jgi:probable HAF family extracellular repeat protein